MSIGTYKIPILIITITIIASFLVVFSMRSSWETWAYQKSIFKEVIELVGNISANSDNVVALEKLKNDFNSYYNGDMILPENNYPELMSEMMSYEMHFKNHILGNEDFYNPGKLKTSGNNLIKKISGTINSGDTNYRLKTFIPLAIGSLLLIFYFVFMAIRKNVKRKNTKASLPEESINEIKKLVGVAKTGDALDKLEVLLTNGKSSKLDEVLMIKAEFTTTKKNRNMNLIDSEEERLANSRTNKAILDFLKNLS